MLSDEERLRHDLLNIYETAKNSLRSPELREELARASERLMAFLSEKPPRPREWRPLFDAEGLIQCEEGELCLFTLRVNVGEENVGWEIFLDSVTWDAESDPEFHADESGWSLTDVEFFMPVTGLLKEAP